MSTLSIRLPESIHRKIKELAEKEGVSVNQLVSSAVAEKVSAILTAEYLDGDAQFNFDRPLDLNAFQMDQSLYRFVAM